MSPARPGAGRARIGRVPEEVGVAIALAVLILGVGAARPDFLRLENLQQIVSSSVFFGLISLSMVFLLALGEIDLSVGWNFNFSAVIAAQAMVAGVNPWLAWGIAIAFGATLGLVNGLATIALRVPMIIVTLGTFSMFQGLSLVVTNSRAVIPPADTDQSFFDFANASVLGVSTTTLIFVVLAIVLHVALHHTRFGYRVQAIGSNAEAARLAGMPSARTRVLALMLVGSVCGLSGGLFVGYRGAIDPTSGSTFMLIVIAAAIIGGTPLTGGSGTVIGAAVGVLVISAIATGVVFLGVDATWSTFVTGFVILLAVAVDRLVRLQRRRSLEAAAAMQAAPPSNATSTTSTTTS